METKECKQCHRNLPINNFRIHYKTSDGHTSICEECRKKNRRANKGINPELSKFTPRELIQELSARGYRGQLEYVQTIKL